MKIRRPGIIRLLGFTTAIGLLAAFTVPATNGGPSYGVAAARDIMALIANRSPGERTHGRLSNTKFARLPHQYAKSALRAPRPEIVPDVMDASPRIIAPLVEPESPFSVANPPVDSGAQAPLPPILVGGGSSGGFIVLVDGGSSGGSSSGGESSSGGSSSGGSSSGGESSSGGDNPPPPSVVPEPATWLTMIIGIGFVGAMLRRRKISGIWRAKAAESGVAGTDV